MIISHLVLATKGDGMEVFGKIVVVNAKPLGTVETMNELAMNIARATKEMENVLIPDVCIIKTRLGMPTKDGVVEAFGRMMLVKTVKTMSAAMNIAKAMMTTLELKIVRLIPDVCMNRTRLKVPTKDGKKEVFGKRVVVKTAKTMSAAMNFAKAMLTTLGLKSVWIPDVCIVMTHMEMATKDGGMEAIGKMVVVKAKPMKEVKTMNAAMNIANG